MSVLGRKQRLAPWLNERPLTAPAHANFNDRVKPKADVGPQAPPIRPDDLFGRSRGSDNLACSFKLSWFGFIWSTAN